eukprot:GHVQ01008931.1.p1 GENE.GHVQ01008931.1~~GHVQ01008931.1.p1  ORF type:complete len:413 (-),score=30.94 GHVQ01008931.1:10-1248(-)
MAGSSSGGLDVESEDGVFLFSPTMESCLTALCPLDGRYANNSEYLRKTRYWCSEWGLMRLRLRVEVEWLQVLMTSREFVAEVPRLNDALRGYMDSVWQDMTVSDGKCIKAYERQTNHDVKSIEYFLKYKIAPDISSPPPMHLLNPTPEIDPERTANGGKHERNKNTGAKPEGRKTEDFYEQLSSQDRLTLRQCKEFVHFGCTSEDINNVAYALMMQAATSKVLRPAMWEALEAVVTLATENAGAAMLSRTHGQPATPTTFGKEMANVAVRLHNHITHIDKIAFQAKFNGAVGNFNAHAAAYPDVDWNKISRTLIQDRLSLDYAPYSTQIECLDYVAQWCDSVSRFNTTLIDLNADLWQYISRDILKLRVKNQEVGSSTMPHKVNPIDFENAEGNLKIANFILRGLRYGSAGS